MLARRYALALAVFAIAGCGVLPKPPVPKVMEEGDCSAVAAIERLLITVSDHGSKVAFRWEGTRFAGTVLTDRDPVPRDASYAANVPGAWERRFPAVASADLVPERFLGFPAASRAKTGLLAATVYEERYPADGAASAGVAIVDTATRGVFTIATTREVQSVAWSSAGDYFVVAESVPVTRMPGLFDLFRSQSSRESPRFDVHATVYAAGGLLACSKLLAGGLPAARANVSWQ